MPAELKIMDDRSGILITGTGEFRGIDIVRVKREFELNEAEVSDFGYWLVDLRQVTSLDISTEDIRDLVEVDRRLAKRMPRAAVSVAAPLDATFGIARMWEIMIDGIGWPTGVFRDFSDAELWVQARLSETAQTPTDPAKIRV